MALSVKSVGSGSNDGSSATVSATSAETTATAVGDLVLVFHGNDYYAESTMSTPTATGSPTLTKQLSSDTTTNNAHLRVWWYVANTAGAQTVSVTETSGGEEKAIAVMVIGGADTTTPFDTSGTQAQTSSSSWTTPSVTTTGSACLLISAVSASTNFHNTNATTPSGFTSDVNVAPDSAYRLLVGHKQLSSSGATGSVTWAASFSEQYTGATLAISPAGGSPSSGASSTVTVGLTAAGAVTFSGTASQTVTVSRAAAGAAGVSKGSSLAITESGTAAGGGTGAPTNTTTVGLSAAGTVGRSSGATLAVTVTGAASSSPSAGGSQSLTVTLTSAGAVGRSSGATTTVTVGLASAGAAGYSQGSSLTVTESGTSAGRAGDPGSLTAVVGLSADGVVAGAPPAGASLAVSVALSATGNVATGSGAALFIGVGLAGSGTTPLDLFLFTPPSWQNIISQDRLRMGVTTSVAVWRTNGVWRMDWVAPPDTDRYADTVQGILLWFTRPSLAPGSLHDEMMANCITPPDDKPTWSPGSLAAVSV